MDSVHFDRSPSLSVEASLLGTLLSNNAAFEQIGQFLRPEHFYDAAHAMLYRRISERIQQGRKVDALLLKIELEHDRMLEEAGGTEYLTQLLSSMISVAGTAEYGRAIRDAWVRREMEATFADAARSYGQPVSEVIANAVARLSELAEPISQRSTFADSAEQMIAESEAAHQGRDGFERLEVGLPSVDRLLGGLWPGNLYAFMARSGTGKTSAAMQFCRHIARHLRDDQHVHVFSLEMPVTDILRISVAAEAHWTAREIRAGEVDDWIELSRVTRDIGALPIEIDEDETDIAALRMRAREIKRKKKTRLIVIDHLGLIKRDPARERMPENLWIPAVAYDLKRLSKELRIPVVVLCQVNKTRTDKDTGRPTKDDLPYASEPAFDEIHAIHRRELLIGIDPPGLSTLHSAEKRAEAKAEWDMQRRAAKDSVEWIALKTRFGALGSGFLRFDGPRQAFREAIPEDHGAIDDMYARGEP